MGVTQVCLIDSPIREHPINKIPLSAVQLPEITPLRVKLSGSSSKSEWVCLNLDAP
jgi:hypothetical protein